MDEFDLTREIHALLREYTDKTSAARILKYLTDWNNSRPLPAAGDK